MAAGKSTHQAAGTHFGKCLMPTWEIRIRGIVQGVGFRPTVFRIAREGGIAGEVSNGMEGVCIRFNASEAKARMFYEQMLSNRPALSHITDSSLVEIAEQFFEKFEIVESQQRGRRQVYLTPDYALCATCRAEMADHSDRRFGYPFIACTQCGPRYSIIEALPYDRPGTAMQAFPLCSDCQSEYEDPLDRRHFAQATSCPQCAISLQLSYEGKSCNTPDLIREAVIRLWESGRIVAIKGIGGYLLTCDATQAAAVQELRRRKDRPARPFAIMYPNIDSLSEYLLSAAHIEALHSEVAPIVLLQPKRQPGLAENLVNGLQEYGIMLPYAPIYEWLLSAYQRPIVATSANISHAPIIYQEPSENLEMLADAVLSNDRPIVVPQDDSLIRFSSLHNQKIILRRSRGLAPSFFKHRELPLSDRQIIAFGADLKSGFALLHESNVYVSQYLGNLSHFDTEQVFEVVMQHLLRVLDSQPAMILADAHPDYASSRLARKWAAQGQVPIRLVPHHEAHFAAVLGEHNLLSSKVPVLGIVWDGTGYGNDGQIWGGECFRRSDQHMERVGQLAYVPSLGGDKMAREPRLSALAMLPLDPKVRRQFPDRELALYDRIRQQPKVQTSSMGRLFDAAASLLDMCQVQQFEGEAAMKLETAASRFLQANTGFQDRYEWERESLVFSGSAVLAQMAKDRDAGMDQACIAAKFHLTLPEMIFLCADQLNIRHIAFSGGVFQNALLVDLIIQRLSDSFQLYFHEQLSPNDENISFGQLMWEAALWNQER
jgi:hydrogenase maturation protein HypF